MDVRIIGGWRIGADDQAKTTQVPELRDVVPPRLAQFAPPALLLGAPLPQRQARRRAMRAGWSQPQNRNYFRRPEHVTRVQGWRTANPGYARGKRRAWPSRRGHYCAPPLTEPRCVVERHPPAWPECRWTGKGGLDAELLSTVAAPESPGCKWVTGRTHWGNAPTDRGSSRNCRTICGAMPWHRDRHFRSLGIVAFGLHPSDSSSLA